MNRFAVMVLAATLTGGCVLQAQSVASLITEQKGAYTAVKNNLLKAADKMSEADYAFQPVKEIRTFGALIAHIAGQIRTCGTVMGEQKQVDMNKTAKADLVALLKQSFDQCDAAWESMNEKTALETIAGRGGQRTKLGTLIGTTVVHNNEEYGYLAVYMRLKGVVPPSSEPRM